MNDVLKKIQSIGIVPVIKLDSAKDALPLAKALCEGGLPCAEITFRTEAAAESIRIMVEAYPDMLVGAGTVLTTEQVDKAVAAGASFIVSPGLNPDIVAYCVEKNIPITPGCSNPSDVEQAIKYGLEVVKFFPAEAAGGLNMIKSMAAPYGNMMFMPTGGINPKNLKSYLDFDKIIACGGTWMIPDSCIQTGDFDTIKKLTGEAVEQMLGFHLVHVGLNMDSSEQAESVADSFAALFGFEKSEKPISFFAGNFVEAMKKKGYGTKGHIAIGTNYVDRAVHYLESKGVQFIPESRAYQENGKLNLIYLKEEIGGFAVHLVQNPK